MELRPYQIELSAKGVKILKEFNIVYFALEPRVGKTLISFETAKNYGANNILFVTKKKAITSILSDFKLFNSEMKLDIINFESVSKMKGNYDLIIVDEAHSISAFPKASKRAKDLKEICKNLPIIFLSGTPTPESFSQIYHQFWISSFSPFKEFTNFYKWSKVYVDVQKKNCGFAIINDYSKAYIDKIEQVTKKYFIDYSQEEAGFTSFIQEQILTVPMNAKIWELCKIIKRDKVYQFKDSERVILADTSVKEQSKIHQISSGTVICENGEKVILSNEKALFIKEKFKGQKIAIYYKFDSERKMIESVFEKTTDDAEKFNKESDFVYVGQFVSSREGVNISTADALIFINIDFSSLSYLQSKARIQTKDRTKESKLYWCFSDKGIERLIYKMVVKKQDFTNKYYKKFANEIGV